MKTGIELITEERQRQISQKGWTPEHDDGWQGFELSLAAISYTAIVADPPEEGYDEQGRPPPCYDWPWSRLHWNPSPDRIRNLTKAGALIAAEIDRLQRLPA